MKIIVLLTVGLISVANAGKVPSSAFKASEYTEALEEAAEKGKPIAIVSTDTASSCPKCQAGNEAVFKRMRSKYVLVVEDKAEKGDALPEEVKQKTYVTYKTKGNFIPIVTVLSEDGQNILGGLCYNQISKDDRGAFRDLDTEVEKAQEGLPEKAAESDEKPEAKEACEEGEMREWTNSEGKTIKAAALSVTDSAVSFKLENGKVVEYPLDKLSEKSREEAKEACR